MEKNKKKILLVATGGTIACEEGENGLRPVLSGQRLIELVQGLDDIAEIECLELMSLDSSNLMPKHWQKIAHTIEENYEAYDGFVVTHGTDTMEYTSAALYYMLRDIGKSVILTGSMLPLESPGTDAIDNVRLAFTAASAGHAGVYIAFSGKLIYGNHAKKSDSKAFDAFISTGRPYAAVMRDGLIEWRDDSKDDVSSHKEFKADCSLDTNVAVIYLTPGLSPEMLKSYVDAGMHGIIVAGYGSGGVPIKDETNDFLPALDYAAEHDVMIVCVSQCQTGGAQLDHYEMGVLAEKHGAISGGSLPIGAATVKLMHVLAHTRNPSEVRMSFEA